VVSGAATIEDLGSTNGTHVKGKRISAPTPLEPGDELALGSEAVQVKRRGPAALTVKITTETRGADKLHGR
jgi:pSer/pThr/pTyr-binding forkhead associated (FHA) protein